MKSQIKYPNSSENEITKTWLIEMQEILGPSKIREKEVEQRISEHINKCFLIVDNFRTKSMFFLLDNANLKYLFVSMSTSSVLGYSKDEILSKGFEWMFSLFSEAELEYKKNVMSDVYCFFKSLDREKILACTIRYDMVVLRKDGMQIHLLEEMMFPEVNSNGEPLITSCFLHDISDYGTTDKRQCNIYLEVSDAQEIIFSKTYFAKEKNKAPLSRREIQILTKFSNGLTTTQVAKSLFVSENTVKTHRKNILLKLKVQNTAEAVSISIKNKWLV